MPLKEWRRPPGPLLLVLFLVTFVSVSALAWFGWKLLRQERIVEAQRAQVRLEETADRIAATLRGTLAETGESLGSWLNSPSSSAAPEEGLLVLLTDEGLSARPAERLLFSPHGAPLPEARPAIFSEAEAAEFQQREPGKAAAAYERLAESSNAAIRAGALVRLARVLRNAGSLERSRSAYARLAQLPGAAVAGVPADLVAGHALADLSGSRAEAETLRDRLLRARWLLTRGQFEFYWAEAARLLKVPEEAAAGFTLAEAASAVWNDRTRNPDARGHQVVWRDARPFLAIWRGGPERRAALITPPEAYLKRILAGDDVWCAVADRDGRILAGRKSRTGHAAVRTAAEAQIPWTIYVTAPHPLNESGFLAQQRFLAFGLAFMVVFLTVGAYFIARAIRREAEVSRMQSDFVSAVSHEFRSPLTSIRQLSELLADGRAPSEERRRVYYDTLVRETSRLQRLIEALLNFGRMEAGAKYRFEAVEAGAVVEGVVAEFAPQLAGTGRHIELNAPAKPCPIQADPEAISVALRNLVDNAIKYSPNSPAVWIEWGVERGRVAIRVRDRGAGIQPSERKAVFRKFVRGSAAAETNVKGSGVGLAMVRHIVAAHRGEISLESEPGQGSTFTILLPALERT